jgi:hypothetical protein
MTIQEAINKEMRKLRDKAIKKGIYENFGQKEYLKLKDKYGDCGLIDDFFKWCISRHNNNVNEGVI